jgi:acyl transferase domain-containing protein
MTNEEIEKAMQFILEQQAQFAANQQQLDERVTRLEGNMADIARAQAEMARALTHMNEVVAVMVDTHRHTEEKLDAFIGVLERYIVEGRNGKSDGGDAS